MLKLDRITKSYHQRGLVLDNLSLEVREGDSVAVTGPSGSGKTTLMNLIGLLDRPDSGSIFFRDRSLLNFSADESAFYRNKNIGFVFQEHLLLPYLTVKENILMPLLASPKSETEFEEAESYADILMAKTGIADLAGKYPFQISGGEAQRATLLRALINKPSILLADEPTGSLDSKNADEMANLLLQMNNEFEITLILATHSHDLAKKMKLHLRLEDGKLNQ